MSLYFLETRRKIEGLYRKLAQVREQIKNLTLTNSEYATPENISFLEMEEESIITKILKLKNLT